LNVGKSLRLRRIIDPSSQTTVMFAFSHGTSAPEVLPGLEEPMRMVEAAARGGANCVFLAPGLIEAVGDVLAQHGTFAVAVKVSATASRGGTPYQEVLTTSVERSLELGADAVVALIPFAPENEPAVIQMTAQLGEICGRWGMPFIAEAEYPNSYYGDEKFHEEWGLPYLKRSARLCAELGADIVKSNWTGSAESFAEIVQSVPVPVVVAGGSRESDLDLLIKLHAAREGGAAGCSVGRNIFQHEAPERMVRAIAAIFREGAGPQEAYDRALGEVVV
jgi:fructose-bisphosphate aldolase / 2-amino-3,7-dideoxy-D-threo-hept-6-ulosonate synthase